MLDERDEYRPHLAWYWTTLWANTDGSIDRLCEECGQDRAEARTDATEIEPAYS